MNDIIIGDAHMYTAKEGCLDELLPGPDLVVKVVEDAGNSHLLEELVLANIGQCSVVGRRPGAALHQDGQRRTIQQRCNGDQTKQVDSVNVLQARKCVSNSVCCVRWHLLNTETV